MDIAHWIVSGLLAAAYIMAGATKATQPKDKLANLPSTKEYSAGTVQLLAIIHHLRHHEAKALPINTVLLVAALFIAIFRFVAL